MYDDGPYMNPNGFQTHIGEPLSNITFTKYHLGAAVWEQVIMDARKEYLDKASPVADTNVQRIFPGRDGLAAIFGML
eukprot:4369473-Karenia_brevis.AAC.1